MSKTRVFFDTNVLVYAHDVAAPHHADSAALLRLAVEGRIQSFTSEQNIIALYRTLTHPDAVSGQPLTAAQARDLINQTYLRGTFKVIYPDSLMVDRVLEMATEANAVGSQIFDVRMAALIMGASIDYFATYDVAHFQTFIGCNPLLPGRVLAALQAESV